MPSKRSLMAISDINVTPMVDVMLVLLIIFMVITPMLSKGVSVDLVKTRNPIAMDEADREDAVLVAVTRDGKVFLGQALVELEALGPEVSNIITNRIDKTVYVKCDQRARFERFVEVIDTIRATGCDQVGLLTERVRDGSSGVVVQ